VSDPLLSVVIPVHDAAPWIGELLDSVLDQDVEAMEVLVVDDRSSDGTAVIIDSFRARDPRVQHLRSDAPGGGGARYTRAAPAPGG
jgi:glycosyltransferase involved in cell wall biosynthesis